MDDNEFISDYLERYRQSLIDTDVSGELIRMKEMLLEVKERGNKVIVSGNGGSAAIAGHIAVDFTKQAGIRTVNFNEPNLITCFANDYGYEKWVSKAIEFYGDKGDIAILISTSGSSLNMLNAAKTAKELNMQVVTFTGFDEENPLKQSGNLNLWVNSRAYNVVENTHQIWLLLVCDLIIGKAEYSA
ncbi:MAG: SIS domain-containing protein [Candidatus Scalindua sp.]|jgi:D-sedoheptulose 7-phosphate isomerase|nr:SIS domain-containing protein [Candidatus Scalindua sp.]